MNKIICKMNPFSLNQDVYVFAGGVQCDKRSIATDNVEEAILDFVDKYDIWDVNLFGSKTYLYRIKERILEEEMTKYNNNKLKISII